MKAWRCVSSLQQAEYAPCCLAITAYLKKGVVTQQLLPGVGVCFMFPNFMPCRPGLFITDAGARQLQLASLATFQYSTSSALQALLGSANSIAGRVLDGVVLEQF